MIITNTARVRLSLVKVKGYLNSGTLLCALAGSPPHYLNREKCYVTGRSYLVTACTKHLRELKMENTCIAQWHVDPTTYCVAVVNRGEFLFPGWLASWLHNLCSVLLDAFVSLTPGLLPPSLN